MAQNAEADALIAFLNQSPTPFHAVEAAAAHLRAAGATPLNEKEAWSLKAGQTVWVERNRSSLLAFRLPTDPSAAGLKLRILAAHTDSPCLKLKPNPPPPSANWSQWGVEVYGGVLFNSWLDRDLGIAGRVSRLEPDGSVRSRLVRMEDKAFRIPQLAIHLDRGVNESGLILNAQRHLVPVMGLSDSGGAGFEGRLAEAAGGPLGSFSFELMLHDRTPAGYGGMDDEFIFSGRLDNLAMSHAALAAFLAAPPARETVQAIALFDHEEVGSVSAQGASSNLLSSALERVLLALGRDRDGVLAALARSHLVSADMAHAIHPNYPEKHEPTHFPLVGHGPVLKANAGQRYATNAETAALFRGLCRRADVPVQDFVTRTDLACGTTIGPHVAAALGIPTVDVGNPMLSMHSAREMCGSEDHGMMIRVMREFLKD
ncbi:MAG TPA: M18 family aminopeptidase [Fibrobacteria bacterium]|nr:M18 family aminopeptidase [Fibrobacteria bacterium]